MKMVVFLSPGRVTLRKRCQALAPSRLAASYRSAEMLCRPARKITIWKPMACQALMITIAVIATEGSPSQSIGGM